MMFLPFTAKNTFTKCYVERIGRSQSKYRKDFLEKQHSQGYCAIQYTAMVKNICTANLLVVCKYFKERLTYFCWTVVGLRHLCAYGFS